MQRLYYGGDIITMRAETDAPEALLVSDGKIAYVGELLEARKRCLPGAEEIDLGGRTLMPSFIDAHSHIAMLAQYTDFVNLGKCESFDDLVETLTAWKEEKGLGAGDILVGYGYDHNFLKEQAHPTRAVLDRVSDVMPVCVLHTSGHMCAANSVLLRDCGIAADTPDPEGGKFGREADGTPDGYVEEVPALVKVLLPVFSRIQTDFNEQLRKAQQVYLKYGVTTVQDGATNTAGFQKLAQAAGQGAFRLDVVSYILADELEGVAAAYPAYDGQYHSRLKIGGAKIILDGSPQGRSAWLSKPYEGEESYRGYPAHTQEEVDRQVRGAVENGRQILAHCNGDAASGQYLAALEKAAAASPDKPDKPERVDKLEKIRALRPVMIHCQTVRDDQLDEMKELGVIPSIFVAHTWYWGDVHLKNLGPERGAHISPVRAALERGLVYNFHQDTPVLEPDMLQTVWCAANRVTRGGQPIGQDQCVGVYDALKGVTCNAAYAYHEEERKGTLEEGKLADLVILDRNPLKTDKRKIRDIQVLETVKEGETLYRKE